MINSTQSNISLQIRLLQSQEKELWDDCVASDPHSCFMQSWVWADFKELEGYQTFRYGLFAENQLVGGCIFHFYPHPSKANLLIAPGGPILNFSDLEVGIELLLKQAEILVSKLGAIALRIEPLWQQKPNCISEFVRAPADLLPSETLLIDLRPSETEMLAAMKQKGRYNLRLSWRYGVTTEFTSDPQAIPVFYDLFWETVKRQNFFGEPYSFFINLCLTLFQANMAEIGFAKWKGEVLAAILVVYFGDRATYLYGASSPIYPQVMASYALHWAAMQRAKTKNCVVYDFYGFTRNPQHSYAKFSQFKSQFGGINITTIGAQDYFFYDRLADTLIGLLKAIGGNEDEQNVI